MTKKYKASSVQKISLWASFIMWMSSGILALWLHNDVLYWIFCLYVLGASAFYYKNTEKLFTGALIIKKFDLKKIRPLSAETNWLIIILFPVPFLIYYLDWKMLLIYTIMCTLWHAIYFKNH